MHDPQMFSVVNRVCSYRAWKYPRQSLACQISLSATFFRERHGKIGAAQTVIQPAGGGGKIDVRFGLAVANNGKVLVRQFVFLGLKLAN